MLESLKEWKGALIVIGILLLFTPLFAWAADLVGYAEPLENAAEQLGANIFNMGIVDVFVGYAVFRALRNFNQDAATFLAGWLGIWLAAVACGIEIGVSSIFKYEIGTTVPIMGIWHGVLGIVEGIITMLVIRYIALRQPDIIYAAKEVVA